MATARIAVTLVSAAVGLGCADAVPLAPREPTVAVRASLASAPTRTTDVVHVPFFIEDATGGAPSAPGTPVYETRLHRPILAPDGRQVTLGEFDAVAGSAAAKCVTQGTHVVLHLSGLIPRGVYSVWSLVFRAPGFDPTFANLTGLGALGEAGGGANTFRASAHGEGTLSAIVPAGPLSVFGAIGACALTDAFEWHVVGAYHLDGQTHGATPGPAGTFVEQFGFVLARH